MTELLSAFVFGLLSSVHCIGMCGGFAAAIGATKSRMGVLLVRQLIYSAGRITTYAFLGACGGFAGLYLSRFNTTLVSAQQMFSLIAGIMMVGLGLTVLFTPRARGQKPGGVTALLAPIFNSFLNARGWSGFFFGGLANGFLPCGLVYVFLAQSMATESMTSGALLMVAFGAGTIPAMVAIGCGSAMISHKARAYVFKIAACFIIIAGAATIKRSMNPKDGDHCCGPADAVASADTANDELLLEDQYADRALLSFSFQERD